MIAHLLRREETADGWRYEGDVDGLRVDATVRTEAAFACWFCVATGIAERTVGRAYVSTFDDAERVLFDAIQSVVDNCWRTRPLTAAYEAHRAREAAQ